MRCARYLTQQTADGRSFAMVTCDPNELVQPIHPKAMITILRPDDVTTWLRAPADEAVKLQRPYPSAQMKVLGPTFPTRGILEPITL